MNATYNEGMSNTVLHGRQKVAEPQPSSARRWLIVAAIVIVLLIVLTWTERSISENIADQGSVFGTFFQTFGEFPPVIVACSATLMIIAAVHRLLGEGSGLHKLALALFSILLALAGFLAVLDWAGQMMSYLRSWQDNAAKGLPIGQANNDSSSTEGWSNFAPGFFVAIIIFIVLAIVVVTLVNKLSEEQLAAVIIAGLVALCVVWAAHEINTGMKSTWGRFRPYEVAAGKGEFTTWLQINFPNGHRSFPSGHTEEGTMMAGIAILLLPFSKKAAKIMMWVGAIYGILMGLSRVLVAAHYPTDTVASFGLTFGLIAAGYVLIQRLQPRVDAFMAQRPRGGLAEDTQHPQPTH
ncbi:phosphatase PAP2 family protein [Corynebacterium uropygiale]|uniref:Phosphatase PAP2 family protein n=1 Tax=Corynebacterium uropygiale TaxID=1775911 RepID=A0A9X1QSK8_9CORY|nr:phosphatase PAP2 family protein [Corynebacterium uropygiale]MCF4006779.1 phosphatase PAP2 family protein [Corynebacterium uropygiale]